MVIEAQKNSDSNLYVEKVLLNGREVKVNYITHEQLLKGGSLSFDMASEPNKKRGISPEAYPYSMNK